MSAGRDPDAITIDVPVGGGRYFEVVVRGDGHVTTGRAGGFGACLGARRHRRALEVVAP